MLRVLYVCFRLSFTAPLGGSYYYPCFADEEMKLGFFSLRSEPVSNVEIFLYVPVRSRELIYIESAIFLKMRLILFLEDIFMYSLRIVTVNYVL